MRMRTLFQNVFGEELHLWTSLTSETECFHMLTSPTHRVSIPLGTPDGRLCTIWSIFINAREYIIVEFRFISLQLNAFRRFNEVSNLVKTLFSL
jgi:hypothetical protein